MKVGILNAIHPDDSKVDWGGSPIDAYVRFFASGGASFEMEGYEAAQGQLPPTPDACDAYVITGSPKGVYDSDPWIGELAEFIRASYAAGKKLIGICFGHQLLAHALGGHAEKSDKGWGFGLNEFTISGAKPWMGGRPPTCSLYFAHQDQVLQLPPGAELLGGNDFCPNAFFTIDGRVLGVQGHPEFWPAIMHDLLERNRSNLTPVQAEAVAARLEQGTPDNALMARWMVSFLTERSVQ